MTDKELRELSRDRRRDREQYKSKRARAVDSPPKAFSDLVGILFKGDSDSLKKIEESRAVLAWPDLVGESAARYAVAEKIRNHKLIVKVRDPLWMQELSLLKHELLKRYREYFPKLGLRDIFFTR